MQRGGDGSNQYQRANTEISGIPQSEAAELLNISADSIGFAKKVLVSGAPSLIESVEKGQVAVSTAAIIAEEPQEKQEEIVARGEKEILAKFNFHRWAWKVRMQFLYPGSYHPSPAMFSDSSQDSG